MAHLFSDSSDSDSSDDDGPGARRRMSAVTSRYPPKADAVIAEHVHNYMRANEIAQRIQPALKQQGGMDAEDIAEMQQVCMRACVRVRA